MPWQVLLLKLEIQAASLSPLFPSQHKCIRHHFRGSFSLKNALDCNNFPYSRFPMWVSLYSCFYCILSNKGLSFLKEVCYAPFNSWMCIYCICWVVWECINWKWSKLSVGHIFPSLPLLFKHRNSSASLVIVNHHLCELPSYSHVFA